MLPALLLLLSAARAQDGEAPGSADPPGIDVPADPAPAGAAASPGGSDPPAVADPADDPRGALEAARTTYLLGRHADAAAALRALLAARDRGAPVPDDVWSEALIYLGEIAYLAGDRTGAEAAFRQVLEFNLDQRISPNDHPMDVIGVFELVREGVTTERRALPPERHPYPWWGYAPLGVPQFKQGQPVRGAVALIFQAGLAGASVGAWVAIDRVQIPANSELPLDEAERRSERAALLRSAVSIPTASLFYVTWGASALDGGLTWRRAHPIEIVGARRPAVQLAFGPRLDAPGLVVVGAF